MANELVPRGNEESGKPPAKRSGKRRSFASKSSALRRAMMAAVTPEDIFEVVKLQVFLARRGDPVAVREVLDRVVGKAPSMTEIIELERAESGGGAVGHPVGTTLEPADTLDALVQSMDATIPFVPDVPEAAPDAPALPASDGDELGHSQEEQSDDAA